MTPILHEEMARCTVTLGNIRAQTRNLFGVSNAKCCVAYVGEHAMAALISLVAHTILTLDEFTMLI